MLRLIKNVGMFCFAVLTKAAFPIIVVHIVNREGWQIDTAVAFALALAVGLVLMGYFVQFLDKLEGPEKQVGTANELS